jgi:hypothetical protein
MVRLFPRERRGTCKKSLKRKWQVVGPSGVIKRRERLGGNRVV